MYKLSFLIGIIILPVLGEPAGFLPGGTIRLGIEQIISDIKEIIGNHNSILAQVNLDPVLIRIGGFLRHTVSFNEIFSVVHLLPAGGQCQHSLGVGSVKLILQKECPGHYRFPIRTIVIGLPIFFHLLVDDGYLRGGSFLRGLRDPVNAGGCGLLTAYTVIRNTASRIAFGFLLCLIGSEQRDDQNHSCHQNHRKSAPKKDQLLSHGLLPGSLPLFDHLADHLLLCRIPAAFSWRSVLWIIVRITHEPLPSISRVTFSSTYRIYYNIIDFFLQ